MLEEPSMAEFLRAVLPRVFPNWKEQQDFICVPHEGKSDLEKSLANKLRAWAFDADRFVVLRDNDSADCKNVKRRLRVLCEQTGRPRTLIRIACQELEAWYLGDLRAISEAFNVNVNTQANRKRYRDPDRLNQPSKEVKKLAPQFQKMSGARAIGPIVQTEGNRSDSFNQFLTGLRSYVDSR